MKIAIYTAIFGGYDQLIPQPEFSNVDYICFTDGDIQSSQWQIRKVDLPVENDYVRSNRYYKILPHKHLPEYDYSIYIDGNFLILTDVQAIAQSVFNDYSMAAFCHSEPVQAARNCIYEEHKQIVKIAQETGKWFDKKDVMQQQINFLTAEQYPNQNGLIAGGVLFRKHHQENVKNTMELWWKMVSEYSRRDQLSFNYAAWKTNLNFAYIPGEVRTNNPWFYRLGGHHQSLWFRLLKYKLRCKFGKIKHPKESPKWLEFTTNNAYL